MSILVKTEPETLSLNMSKQAEYPLSSYSKSPVVNNVLGLPDGHWVAHRQETWTAPVREHAKNPQNVVYVEGPPPQYNPGQGYAPTGGYSSPPVRQGYFATQPQSVYYAAPPPPPNVGRGGESHRPGQVQQETVGSDEPFGQSFDDKYIRARFIRKVYALLTCQLLVTTGFIAFFVLHKPTQRFVWRNMWLYWLSFAVFFVTYIAIVCCSSVRRQSPWNLIALTILTLAESYMTAVFSSFHDTYIVLMAIGATAVVCLLVSVFACQTRCDITGWGSYMCVGSLVLMIFGIIALLVGTFTNFKLLYLIYAALGALFFSLYLMFDTQQIMGGRKVEISPEEHIAAVVELYMDIILIFTFILTLCGWGD